jgi:hypothetical protein
MDHAIKALFSCPYHSELMSKWQKVTQSHSFHGLHGTNPDGVRPSFRNSNHFKHVVLNDKPTFSGGTIVWVPVFL